MTFTLLNIDSHHQKIVSLIFNNIAKEFKEITESNSGEQISTFLRISGSFDHSFIEALFKNPPPVVIKDPDRRL